MHHLKLLPAILLTVTAAAFAAKAQPLLPCPQCGDWTLSYISPVGAVGQRIVIDENLISIPTCGDFAYAITAQNSKVEKAGTYKYSAKLTLDPIETTTTCKNTSDKPLTVEAEIRNRFNRDGGIGDFQLYDSNKKLLLSATGWNRTRDDPCGSGSGEGQLVCSEFKNADLYQTLSLETYEAFNTSIPRKGTPIVRAFNPARFAAQAYLLCTKQEVSSGTYWELHSAQTCISERLQTKLDELRHWKICIQSNEGKHCQFPSEEK